MPSERFHHAVSIQADRQSAWDHLQHAATWEALAGIDDVTDVVHDGDGQLESFRFVAVAAGKRYPGTAVVSRRSKLELMHLDIESTEVSGSIESRLTDDHPLMLSVTLQLTSKGLLSTMFFPVVAASVGSGFPRQVDAFAARVAAQD